MDVGVSFQAGVPVLTAVGRFDGPGARTFDQHASLRHKRYATCGAALICRAIQRVEGR